MRATRLSDQAYDHIKRMMLGGSLSAGEWLPVETIAADLGASRQPVMDAIKRLAMEGFVEIVPQVGCRVCSPGRQEIEDFYRLFAAGEGLIADIAARRASPSDVLNLRLISGQIGELLRSSKDNNNLGENYRLLNRRFHSEMRNICNSPSMTAVVESLGDRSDFYIALAKRPVFGPNVEHAHEEHEKVVAAIADGKPDDARAAMETHIFSTQKRLLEQTSMWSEEE